MSVPIYSLWGPRILGDSSFAESLRLCESVSRRIIIRAPLAEIIKRVTELCGIAGRALSRNSRSPQVVNARTVACHLALEVGYSAAEIGRYLRMSRYGVSVAGIRGKKLMEENEEYAALLDNIDKSAS